MPAGLSGLSLASWGLWSGLGIVLSGLELTQQFSSLHGDSLWPGSSLPFEPYLSHSEPQLEWVPPCRLEGTALGVRVSPGELVSSLEL